MADVKVLKEEGLNHEFSVVVPQKVLEDRKSARLAEICKTAKMQGFRPGKVPLAVVAKLHGAEAYGDALEHVVSEAVEQTMKDRKIRPALQPQIDWVATDEGKDVEFKLKVEALPVVTIKDFGTIELERPTTDVAASKVDDAISKIMKRLNKPETVSEARAAAMGDVVVIDFEGSVDGNKRDDMKGANHALELGSKSFIDTFEDQLVGLKVSDKKTITVTFPEKYQAEELAGKKAKFDVEIKELRAYKPFELDDAMAKGVGFPSIEKLRERVRDDIAADYARIGRSVVKRALMDKLSESYVFEVPNGLLEAEFDGIWKQVEDAKGKGELPDEDKGKTEDQLRKEYREIAERRIRLGLLLAEVAAQNKIEVSSNELRNALMAEARRFPGQEKAVFDYYTNTRGAIERIRAPLLEEKVVDFIIGKAKVTDKKVSEDDLFSMPEMDEE